MDDALKPVIDLIPEKWRTTVILSFFAFPYVTRGLYALRSGTGLVGFFKSILFGTNTPSKTQPKEHGIAEKLLTLILIAVLSVGVFSMSGCATTGEQTREAVVFNSFASTWAVAHEAYKGYAELAVQGKVSTADQNEIDAAWNKFRAAFKFSFAAASRDWNASSPDELNKLRDDLIIIIRAL